MKILVVEDDPVSQKLLARLLREFGDCEVVENGRLGLERFKQSLDAGAPYDLLCLDIMMPELSGQQLLVAVREFEERIGIQPQQGVKIIMTTSLDDAENVVGAFQNGCEAYITKPINRESLFGELRKLGISPSAH